MEELQKVLDNLLTEIEQYKSLNVQYNALITSKEAIDDRNSDTIQQTQKIVKGLLKAKNNLDKQSEELSIAIATNHNDLKNFNDSYNDLSKSIKKSSLKVVDTMDNELKATSLNFSATTNKVLSQLETQKEEYYHDQKSKYQKLFNQTEDEIMRIIQSSNRQIEDIKKNIDSHITELINEKLDEVKQYHESKHRMNFYVLVIIAISLVVILIKVLTI